MSHQENCCGKPESCERNCSLKDSWNNLAGFLAPVAKPAAAGTDADSDNGIGARGLERTPTPTLEDYRRGTPEPEEDKDRPRTLLDEYRRGSRREGERLIDKYRRLSGEEREEREERDPTKGTRLIDQYRPRNRGRDDWGRGR